MWIINFPDNDTSSTSHLLDQSRQYLVGRSPSADFHTENHKVSKKQFGLSFKDGSLMVQALGRAKFLVNGEKVSSGTTLKFGASSQELVFEHEPFKFSVHYEPFILGDKRVMDTLVSRGVPAEFSEDAEKVSHYLLGSDDTIGMVVDACESGRDVKVIGQEFVDALNGEELQTDFGKFWPVQRSLFELYVCESGELDRLGKLFGDSATLTKVDAGAEDDLPVNSALWDEEGTSSSLFSGLVVTRGTIVSEIVENAKKTVTLDEQPPPKKKRKGKEKSAISGLQTMLDFGFDDFEVIRTEDPKKDESKTAEPEELEPNSPAKEKEEEIHVSEAPPADDYIAVDLDKYEKMQEKEEEEHEVKSHPAKFAKLEEGTSNTLAHAFKEAKRTREEDAQKEKNLIESLDKLHSLGAKVTKFHIGSDAPNQGPRVYIPSIRGTFSNPDWTNRKDFSHFRKTTTQSNVMTDSTIKGIKMKKAGYNSDGIGQMTSEAEKQLMQFNEGIEDLDRQFEQPRRKRAAPTRTTRAKRTSTRTRKPAKQPSPTPLFVDEVATDDDDNTEPSFTGRVSQQTRKPVAVEEDDDVPVFRRRRR